jgi:SH3 domain protein
MTARAHDLEGAALMIKWIASLVLLSSIVLGALPANAETQYITDELTVPLRRGPSNAHKIVHAGLPSGMSLEIISEDKAAGFTQVRTPNGTEGWVPTQFLSKEPSARDRLAAATKRVETLTAEIANMRQGMKAEQSARSSAEGASSDLGKQVKQLQNELNEIRRVSSSAVATYEENKALKAQNEQLQQAANDQAVQIKSLKGNELEMWLLTGGGLVVLGLIFGIALKSRPKTRSGW